MATSTATDEQNRPALDDLMMAMDVVDTLRHDERLVERELAEEDREAALLKRLREVYSSQGIEVTDKILRDGVAALKDDRFTYVPPAGGLQVTLAKLYINRGRVAVGLAVAVALLVVVVLAYQIFVLGPQRANDRLLAETLPAQITELRTELVDQASDPTIVTAATPLVADAEAALSAGDVAETQAAVARLETLQSAINTRYEVVIVNKPNVQSGVWRIPPTNQNTRNYYLIVEAIGPGGDPIAQTITSEESGETKTVEMFGVRVPERVFNAVGQDKTDDGIIQNNVIGTKERGVLAVDWSVPVEDGRIFEW